MTAMTSTSPRKLPPSRFQFVFSLFMAGMMAFVMTFFITLINIGFTPDFFARWLTAYVIAFLIAVPAIYVIAPIARKLTTRWVQMP